jgi:diguanylate cyclase (GGDEF)-like protein
VQWREPEESPRLTPEKLATDIARDSTIMMVDDATTTLKVLQAFLEDAGYQNFLPVSQPADAFQTLLDNFPDVVLLDINMPGVSGFDILSFMRAREAFQYTPVIVLTSSDDPETKLKALQLGATDFLAKPVDESELVLRLRNTLVAKRYLDQQTYYDRVTGLANRRLFMDRLTRAVNAAERKTNQSAVLLINVDRFKKINDSLGHTVGDELLQAIAHRLDGLVRSNDVVNQADALVACGLVARIGGDEFTVLLSDVQDVEVASRIAERVLKGLARSFRIRGQELFITASIGIAVFPEHGKDKENLLKHADVALSHAKRKGRNCFQAYSKAMDRTDENRLTLESELHRAIERQEFVLHYQPKVDVRTGIVAGAETLVRWNHPERGMVPPGQFITLAEESGLIGAIGDWVLKEACRQNAAWHSTGLRGLALAVNVSGHQFRDRHLVGRVRQVLMETGLPANCLTLELTEGVMIEDAKENIDVLHALKDSGVNLSVDDFGTGYSSLSYLEQFPLDELKVDRSFISKIDPNSGEAPIVSAIIAMAHSLRFSLVAEGVETEEQLSFLRRNRCEFYQGYLFSKPLPADDFAALAKNWRP